jgi:hypothetical protein
MWHSWKDSHWSAKQYFADHTGLICQMGSVLAYGFVAPIWIYVNSVALRAYNETCALENVHYITDEYRIVAAALIIIAVPVLLAHSDFFIKTNAVLSLSALLWAASLILTAATPPDECFSSGGSYEDRVSGQPEFVLFFLFLIVLSYSLVLIELSHWAIRKIIFVFRARGEKY